VYPRQENPDAHILYGQILYPYAYGDRLTFDFLSLNGEDTSYAIPRNTGLTAGLRNGEFAYIALQSDNQGNEPQVESIYRWQGPKRACSGKPSHNFEQVVWALQVSFCIYQSPALPKCRFFFFNFLLSVIIPLDFSMNCTILCLVQTKRSKGRIRHG